MTKITFQSKDEVLAAVIRALASKTAGNQVVGGMTDAYLHTNGFYRFDFSHTQNEKFKGFVAKYVPQEFQNTLSISLDSN